MGDIRIVSCYVSPNVDNDSYSRFLDSLDRMIDADSLPLIIAWDFNAHSILWGSPVTDGRGELVEEWTAARDLRLANVGIAYTCVRHQGCSIIDLTWTTPNLLDRLANWIVLEEAKTLSDHQYVEFTIRDVDSRNYNNQKNKQKRWNFVKLDCDLFVEILEFLTNTSLPDNMELEPESYADWLMQIMKSACNVSAPLIKKNNVKRQAYWWSEEIAKHRRAAIKARRI